MIGYGTSAYIGAQVAFQWIKKHPGDAAEIAGSGAEAAAAWYQALRNSGLEKTADAVGHALGQGNSGSGEVGDVVQVPGCDGLYQVKSVTIIRSCMTSEQWTSQLNRQTCTQRFEDAGGMTEGCLAQNGAVRDYKVIKLQKVADLPGQSIPETLSDAQAQRLLDKIEEYLNTHKEQMERELDELLKKNLNDIDWPKYDADAAKNYLREHEMNKINSKLDDLKRELQEELDKPDCQNESDKCNSTICCNTCKVTELQREIQRLEEKADDKENKAMKEDVNESYDAPNINLPELKRIDFTPIVELQGVMMGKFPFRYLSLLPNAFEVLTAAPVAPSFEANLGIGGQHTISFSVFDGVASLLRLVIAWLLYIAAIFFCLKMWSRF